jgi:hypothetical protein
VRAEISDIKEKERKLREERGRELRREQRELSEQVNKDPCVVGGTFSLD